MERFPRVDIVSAYVGGDDSAIRAFVDAGAEGLVVDGYAYNGRASADQLETVTRLAADGLPVVLSNRGGIGRIPVNPDDPFIQGDTLPAHKARILLMLALTRTRDLRDIQRIFGEY
jgi:L-asparaginase